MTPLATESDEQTWPLVLLALASPWTLARVAPDGSFTPVGWLPTPLSSIVRRDPAGRIWALDPDARIITGFAADDGDVRELVVHPIPRGFDAADMAVDESRIYLGGGPTPVKFETLEEFLQLEAHGAPDVADAEPTMWFRGALDGPGWTALAAPLDSVDQKSVDALVLDPEQLVAVDDMIFPKWFFVFDPKPVEEPKHRRTIELQQGPNEWTLHGAAASPRWIALRSHCSHRGGAFRQVTVYARETLQPSGRHEDGPGRTRHFHFGRNGEGAWGGAAFVGERLLVAALGDGLMEIDCAGLPVATEPVPYFGCGPLDERRRWSPFAGASVLDVVPVEAWGGALLIVDEGDARRAVWHRVDL